MRARALKTLKDLYPQGYRSFSIYGKRLSEPVFVPTASGDGWISHINGESHLFNHAGELMSHGDANFKFRGKNRRSINQPREPRRT